MSLGQNRSVISNGIGEIEEVGSNIGMIRVTKSWDQLSEGQKIEMMNEKREKKEE
jgi:hypothetical protein